MYVLRWRFQIVPAPKNWNIWSAKKPHFHKLFKLSPKYLNNKNPKIRKYFQNLFIKKLRLDQIESTLSDFYPFKKSQRKIPNGNCGLDRSSCWWNVWRKIPTDTTDKNLNSRRPSRHDIQSIWNPSQYEIRLGVRSRFTWNHSEKVTWFGH